MVSLLQRLNLENRLKRSKMQYEQKYALYFLFFEEACIKSRNLNFC